MSHIIEEENSKNKPPLNEITDNNLKWSVIFKIESDKHLNEEQVNKILSLMDNGYFQYLANYIIYTWNGTSEKNNNDSLFLCIANYRYWDHEQIWSQIKEKYTGATLQDAGSYLIDKHSGKHSLNGHIKSLTGDLTNKEPFVLRSTIADMNIGIED